MADFSKVGNQKGGGGGGGRGFGFDPAALERAAQAVRELNASPHAAMSLQAIMKQEEAKKAENLNWLKQKEIEKVKTEHEEKRKTIELELEVQKKRADYINELKRKSYQERLEDQEKSQERINKQNEESTLKQEEMKKKTIEFQFKKQEELEEKKAILQAKANAKIQRENHDLEQANIVLKESERRKTLLEVMRLNYNMLWSGGEFLLNNKHLAWNLSIYVGAMAGAFFMAKASVRFGFRFLESKFGKPSLVRETSRVPLREFYKFPGIWLRRSTTGVAKSENKIFSDVILHKELQEQLRTIANSIVHRKKNLAPMRNLTFYGPPGTGKTLFAKKLAYFSGMDFAIMTGADVAPLGPEAVSEIHKVFDWANRSNRGMILFIDEADAYFRKRQSCSEISENLRNSINTFLYRTGTSSKKFMFILATNTPEQLDSALNDRVDQLVHFDLPAVEERVNLLYLYLTKYCDPNYRIYDYLKDLWHTPSSLFYRKKLIKMAHISPEKINEIAGLLTGFSAREIEKLAIACHDIAFSQKEPILTTELLDFAVSQALKQHNQRKTWEKSN